MGDENDVDDVDDDHSDEGEDGSDDSEKSFSQSELSALLTRENRRGQRAAERKVKEALGGRTPTEVKALLDKLDQREQADMTDAQRLQAEAAKAKADAENAMRTAAETTLRAQVLVALQEGSDDAPGVRPDRLSLAGDIAFQHALRSDEDPDEAIAEAVEHVRKSSPEWFSALDDGRTSRGGGTTKPPGRTGREASKRGTSKPDRANKMLERFNTNFVDRRPFPTEN